MEYDIKILEERFNKLPEEIQQALCSTEVISTIKEIGQRHGLKVDQEGALFDQVAYALLGLVSSKDFVASFSKESGVDEKTAHDIAEDINKEVFEKIKSSMQSTEEEKGQGREITSLEHAGGFEIEKDIPGNGERGVERANATAAAMTETDKINMLSDIENPKPVKETLSEEILHAPPMSKPPQAKNQPPVNLPTSDPYREPMK